MSTITQTWDEGKIRLIIINLDKNWTIEETKTAYHADDVKEFDILAFIKKWNQVPVDQCTADKMLLRIKTQFPHAYYEIGDEVFHSKRGYGIVVETIPCNYWTQKICVQYATDHVEEVYTNKSICKMINGVPVPYRSDMKNINIEVTKPTQITIEDLFPDVFV